jgi:hypothetical protein
MTATGRPSMPSPVRARSSDQHGHRTPGTPIHVAGSSTSAIATRNQPRRQHRHPGSALLCRGCRAPGNCPIFGSAGATRPPRCTMILAEATESTPSRCAVALRALTRRPRPREMAATRTTGRTRTPPRSTGRAAIQAATPLRCLGQPHTRPYLPSQVSRKLERIRTVSVVTGTVS